jgi:hypothetical protein
VVYVSALAKARSAGTPLEGATYLSDLAALELAAGRTDAAERRTGEAIAALREVGRESAATELEGILAWVAARRGDRAGAEARLAVAARGEETFASVAYAAATREALGDWERAIALRRQTVDAAGQGTAPGPLLTQRCALARDLRAAGKHSEFERLAREIVREADRLGARAAAEEMRGLLAGS